MSHTPGPWMIYNTRRGRILGAWRVCSRDGHRPICTMPGKLPPEEEMANARLVEASPELLEACRLLMRAEPMQQGERNGAIMGRISTAIDAARAALEKATGKSK